LRVDLQDDLLPGRDLLGDGVARGPVAVSVDLGHSKRPPLLTISSNSLSERKW